MAQTLRAADWAHDNLDAVKSVLQSETRGTASAVSQAYSGDALSSLHLTLDAERLELFEQQKRFTWVYGFSEREFSLADWVDERPLARQRYARARARLRAAVRGRDRPGRPDLSFFNIDRVRHMRNLSLLNDARPGMEPPLSPRLVA